MKRLFLFLTIALGFVAQARAGEITLGWSKYSDVGTISDMLILPGDSTFLMLVGDTENGQFQIRNILTGDSISAFPSKIYSEANCELTPDSNRIIIASTEKGNLALCSLPDFKVFKAYLNKADTFSKWYNPIAVDPVRPYVYAIVFALKNNVPGQYVSRGQVIAFNYETMERVHDFTEFSDVMYDCIAVSRDGKYLAAINRGESHLKVWDLETRALIRDHLLCYDISEYSRGNSKGLSFMPNNSNRIVLCGRYPKIKNSLDFQGILIYDVEKDNIVDSTFAQGSNRTASSIFVVVNDSIIAKCDNIFRILNLSSQETMNSYNFDQGVHFVYGMQYSANNSLFIGYSSLRIGTLNINGFNTAVNEKNEIGIITPNPTTNEVTLQLMCTSSKQYYEVLNANGELLVGQQAIENGATSVRIDFSTYPAGVYFVRVGCGNETKTYKVVKEG